MTLPVKSIVEKVDRVVYTHVVRPAVWKIAAWYLKQLQKDG